MTAFHYIPRDAAFVLVIRKKISSNGSTAFLSYADEMAEPVMYCFRCSLRGTLCSIFSFHEISSPVWSTFWNGPVIKELYGEEALL
jgi:hypothetical protein